MSCEAAYRDAKSPETAKLAADAWQARGIALRETGDTSQSIAAFTHAAELRDPNDVCNLLNDYAWLSERYTAAGDLRQALFVEAKEARIARGCGPAPLARVSVNVASDLVDLGDVEDAAVILGDIPSRLALDDGYRTIALLNRGEINRRRGRLELARVDLEAVRQTGDQSRRHEATLYLVDIALKKPRISAPQRG